MKYILPKYLEPGVKTTRNTTSFGAVELTAPVFVTPITARENFIRAANRDNPIWVPIMTSDIQTLLINELADERPGMQLGPRFMEMPKDDYVFLDLFGNSWSWVASAGGAMLTPGTQLVKDIHNWEKIIKFPDFDSGDWNFRETAEKYMRNTYDPNKVMHINIHQGLTEMLVAFLGGYEEGMLALLLEPEACRDFFVRYARFMTDFFDYLDTLYPIDFITYHDDWGTERDTFFSPGVMEELVYEPTKTIVDHIKGCGKVFELHCCGRIERFVPYMCELGIDFLQIQRRANDMPKLKLLYGDRIGFNAPIEGMEMGIDYSDDDIAKMVRRTVDIYGAGGGLYPWILESDPRKVWNIASEIYCYSREFYENEKNE